MSEYIIDMGSSSYQSTSGLLCADVSQLREEIVRCRDCKYYESVPEDSGDWCGYWTDRVYGTDGFCAWGECKEVGE